MIFCTTCSKVTNTAQNVMTSPRPSPILEHPWISNPSPRPRRVLDRETRPFESETRDSGNSALNTSSQNKVRHWSYIEHFSHGCFTSSISSPLFIFLLLLRTTFFATLEKIKTWLINCKIELKNVDRFIGKRLMGVLSAARTRNVKCFRHKILFIFYVSHPR